MRYIRFGLLIGITLTLLVSSGYAQQDKKNDGKKAFTFRGKVEKIEGNKLVVAGQKVEGWMGAMTMSYSPDKPDVVKTLKVGDEITATVYDGNFQTLYDVKVVPPAKK